jgi:branched-chain amino acid aminotransferase
MNSQLVKMEAVLEGYAEGIALDSSGFVSEGSGENIFLVKGNELYTPPISCSILVGATRDSVITLAREMGYTVREERIPREMLYIVDEVFFTGSAAEITPIKSIDKIVVGKGSRGAVTEKLQKAFFAITKGEVEDTRDWLTYVERKKAIT